MIYVVLYIMYSVYRASLVAHWYSNKYLESVPMPKSVFLWCIIIWPVVIVRLWVSRWVTTITNTIFGETAIPTVSYIDYMAQKLHQRQNSIIIHEDQNG